MDKGRKFTLEELQFIQAMDWDLHHSFYEEKAMTDILIKSFKLGSPKTITRRLYVCDQYEALCQKPLVKLLR